jgi:hypothetical protein
MERYIPKKSQKNKSNYKTIFGKQIPRFWGNATRLEHSNVRNKNKSKKG